MIDLTKFQATGSETCFHGRHIQPQIYADLDGRSNSVRCAAAAVRVSPPG